MAVGFSFTICRVGKAMVLQGKAMVLQSRTGMIYGRAACSSTHGIHYNQKLESEYLKMKVRSLFNIVLKRFIFLV